MKKMHARIQNRLINNTTSTSDKINTCVSQIENPKCNKVVLVGSTENRDKFLKECISAGQLERRTIGQDCFIATIADDFRVQVWNMLAAGITSNCSVQYFVKNSDAIIFLEPAMDEQFITRAKRKIANFVNEELFHYYYFQDHSANTLTNSPKEFLKNIYIKELSIQLPENTNNVVHNNIQNAKIKIFSSASTLFKKSSDEYGIELLELNNINNKMCFTN